MAVVVEGTPMIVEAPMVTVMEEEVMAEETPEVMEEEVMEEVMEEEFIPLDFNGKLKRFAKKHGGIIIEDNPAFINLGAKKVVKVGNDYYGEGKDGLFVVHNSKLIMIDNITDASGFCDGWEEGYQQALDDCLKIALTPLCPLEPIGSEGYKTGYGRGYAAALATYCD